VYQNIDDHLSILLAAASGDFVTQYRLFAIVVHPVAKNELAAAPWAIDRPARQTASYLLYVFLRRTAVDPHRVTLHSLAGVILINSGLALAFLVWSIGIWLLARRRQIRRPRSRPSKGSPAEWSPVERRPVHPWRLCVRRRRLSVVEIKQHGGAFGRGH